MPSKIDVARALNAKIKMVVSAIRRSEARLAGLLLAMEEHGFFRSLGYSRIQDYAEGELELPPSKTKDLLELARRSRSLPEVRRAFQEGDIPWTKARQIARVATTETEAAWVERARSLSSRALERAVAAARGEAPRVRIMLDLSEADAADLDQAVRRLREERREAVPLGDAVAELCRRAMGPPSNRPGYQVVIHECPACGAASRDARDGPIEVPPLEAAAAKHDAEVVDLREEKPRAKRSITPAERRVIIARDHDRCAKCGTQHWLHIHHLEPRPDGISGFALLCSTCHQGLVHSGHVSIRGEAPSIDFLLCDGSSAPRGPRHVTPSGPEIEAGRAVADVGRVT